MSGDFSSFGSFGGLDPEWLRLMQAQWQAAQMQQPMAGMDLAKMGAAPAMPVPAAGGQAAAAPAPAAEPAIVGDPRQERGGQIGAAQQSGLMRFIEDLTGGGQKGPDSDRRQPDIMAALRGLSGGAARPAGGGSGGQAPAPAPASHRPQGGGALPMREPTPGNPYLKRRRGLLDDE